MPGLLKIKTIFKAGIIAAALDIAGGIIIYAFLLQLTTTEKILQTIATGIYGGRAFDGGWEMAFKGLIIHIMISLAFATLYMIIYPVFKGIISNKVIAGLFYGCIVWCIMNMLVIPFSNASLPTFNLKYFAVGVSLVILLVGIPISIITDNYYVKLKKRRDRNRER